MKNCRFALGDLYRDGQDLDNAMRGPHMPHYAATTDDQMAAAAFSGEPEEDEREHDDEPIVGEGDTIDGLIEDISI